MADWVYWLLPMKRMSMESSIHHLRLVSVFFFTFSFCSDRSSFRIGNRWCGATPRGWGTCLPHGRCRATGTLRGGNWNGQGCGRWCGCGIGVSYECLDTDNYAWGIIADYYHTFSHYMKNRYSISSVWKILFWEENKSIWTTSLCFFRLPSNISSASSFGSSKRFIFNNE